MTEREIFLAALDRADPAARAAYLDVACGGDAARRERVEALLRSHDEAGSFLAHPAVAAGEPHGTAAFASGAPGTVETSATGTFAPDAHRPVSMTTGAHHPDGATGTSGDTPTRRERPSAVALGTVVAGRYTLVEVIGEGGMGSVYLASQSDPVKRQVALKLIKTGMDSKAVLARFEAERQALALMDHPNIARIYDGGVTASGQPFFVMELVKGVPLTEYCDTHRLPVAARLELFVSVCQAVQHAHQKGIIHRDLKPGNVLVTEVDGRPTPKVIDFGVAKATEQKLTDQSFSDTGAIVGTPAYMSPEQADPSSMDIDTRTDVYALGVMLYELLTGSAPIDAAQFRRGAVLEILRMVREVEPPRPSTKLSTADDLPNIAANRNIEPARLVKELRGELDWIVMKALEKDRTRRYETANGLARDVQRYLADEVVEARPPSVSYRLKKFIRRHKVQVIAASLVLFALLAGMAGTTWGWIEARLQTQEVERQKDVASTEAEAKEQARLEEKKQREKAEAKEQEALLAKKREEDQRAKAEVALERTYRVLDAMVSGVTRDALTTQSVIAPEQKKFLTEALAYYKEFVGDKVDDEKARVRAASAAYHVGVIEFLLGHNEAGLRAFQMARNGYQELAADFPTVPDHRSGLAASHNQLGIVFKRLGKWADAEEEYRKAVALRQKVAADFPKVSSYTRELARSYVNLGNLLTVLGRQADAEQEYRNALTAQERLAADFPTVPDHLYVLAVTHNSLGNLLKDLKKLEEAGQHLRNGLTILNSLSADYPSVPDYRQTLAMNHNNLSVLIAARGQSSREAVEHCEKALAIRKRLVADFPTVPAYYLDLAVSHFNLGNRLGAVGKRPEAVEHFRSAIAIEDKLVADFPTVVEYRSQLAATHTNLGVLLRAIGERPEAEEHFRSAIAIEDKLVADFPTVVEYRSQLATSRTNLAILLAELAKWPEAEQQYRKALVIREKLVADFPTVLEYRRELGVRLNELALMLAERGQREEAEAEHKRALTVRQQLVTDFPAVAAYQVDLGGSYCNFGNLVRDTKPVEAVAWFQKAIDILRPVYEKEPNLAFAKEYLRISHWNRAIVYDRLEKYVEAVKDWDRMVELTEGPVHPKLRVDRALSLLRAGQTAAAVAEVEKLTTRASAPVLCTFAGVYAVASETIADKKQEYADRAMKLLQKAVNAGYTDAARIKRDKDLDSLRDRDDFKKLLADLEAKYPPLVERAPPPREKK